MKECIASLFKNKKKFLKIALSVIFVLIIVFTPILIWGNVTLHTEHITIETNELSDEFNGYKIAHISDFHNNKQGNINDSLFEALITEKPDVIFITGDLIDCHRTDIDCSLAFVKKVIEIAPVYYVTGNHECNVSIENQQAFDNMIVDLKKLGVTVMRNESTTIELSNDNNITVHGINDPYFHCYYASEVKETTDELCSELTVNEGFNILLAHHPEQLDVYSDYGFDLVYSGHAHGGQVRLFGQGIIAPDQGFFPNYTNGLYTEDETTLIVSRGIGNSLCPVRVFDRPHLIFTEIKTTHFTDK